MSDASRGRAAADPVVVLRVAGSATRDVATALGAERDGVTVAVAGETDAALTRLDRGERVDCLVCDAATAVEEGGAFLDAVAECRPGLPVVAVGTGSSPGPGETLAAGATDHVTWDGEGAAALLARRVASAVGEHRVAAAGERLRAALPGGDDGSRADDDAPPDPLATAAAIDRQAAALTDRLRQGEAVETLGRHALQGRDPDWLLDECARTVADALDADCAAAFALEDDRLRMVAGTGWPDGWVDSVSVPADDGSQPGHSLAAGTPVVTGDPAADDRFAQSDLLADHGVRAGVTALVGPPADPWGVVGAFATSPREFAARDAEFCLTVGGMVWTAVQRDRRETERRHYETMLETVDDGVFATDETGTILAANDAFVSMTGRPREAVVGESVETFTTGEMMAEGEAAWERLAAGTGEAATVEGHVVAADGSRLPVESRFRPVAGRDDDWAAVTVVRDVSERRSHERRLAALHASSERLIRATTPDEVADLLVDAGVDVLDLPRVAAYRFDPGENCLRPVADSRDGDPASTLPVVQPSDASPVGTAFFEGESTTCADPDGDAVLPDGEGLRSGLFVPLGDHGVLVAGDAATGGFDTDTRELADLLAGSARAALDRIRRETELRDRDQQFRDQTAQLERLDRVNEAMRRVTGALVRADGRADVEQSVCEELAAVAGVGLAWVGEHDPDAGAVVPRSWAGEDRGYLDVVSFDVDGGSEPAVRAATTGETVTEDAIADDLRDGDWRQAALARDFRSALAVPLAYGGVTYGVLSVYGTESERFAGRTAAVLSELGEAVAFAVDAARRTAAMPANSAVELEFEVRDARCLLVRLSDGVDATLRVEGVVTTDDDGVVVFADAPRATPEQLRDATDLVSVSGVRVLDADDDGCRVQLSVSGRLPLVALADRAGELRGMAVEDGVARVTFAVPGDGEVRRVVDSVTDVYPDAELLAKRTTDGSTAAALSTAADSLTDRQREVLGAAVHGGYFESPRESTGVELATAFDISSTAFHDHLRAAQRKVLSSLF